MAQSDVSKQETVRIVRDMHSPCPKAKDGKHSWLPYGEGSRCEHCGAITEKRILFG